MARRAALALALWAAVSSPAARAQAVSVSPGAVDLTVPYTLAGYGTAVSTTTTLSWTGPNGNNTHKITVGTTAPGQGFTLRVTPTSPINGTATGPVTLLNGAGATDLIHDVARRAAGQATLRYEAGVPAGYTGTRSQDAHTVVFTITRQ